MSDESHAPDPRPAPAPGEVGAILREAAEALIAHQKDRTGRLLGDFAGGLRRSGQALDEQPRLGALADGTAAALEDISERIRAREVGDMIRDAEDFVRRHPLAVGAGAAALGLLAARFVKSSAARAEARAAEDRSDATRAAATQTVNPAGSGP